MATVETKGTFRIITLGCKVNAYESELYREAMSQYGYHDVGEEENADIYIINTCAVTNTAAAKCRQRIHALRRDHPDAFIAAVGCYVQISRNDFSPLADCDALIGTFEKTNLARRIDEAYQNHNRVIAVPRDEGKTSINKEVIHSFYQTRAYLRIEDGCNQFCSYCVIPYARGRERSLGLEDVLANARALTGPDHQELVLTGIHTGRWKDGDCKLSDLIRALLNRVPGLKRLRISSIEMNEVDDDILRLIQDDPRMARHLHIPMQAAADSVLRDMHRPYTVNQYLHRIHEIRRAIPDISISSDIIAGFPGESDEVFEEEYATLQSSGLSFLHVFPFSPRQGTPAAARKDQVAGNVKRQRVTRLSALSTSLYDAYKEKKCGDIVSVYVEKQEDGLWFGHSSEYLPVWFASEQPLSGKFVDVQLTCLNNTKLYGKMVER